MLFILKQCYMLTQEGSENRHMIHSSPRSASCLLVLLIGNMWSRSKQPMRVWLQRLLFDRLTVPGLHRRQRLQHLTFNLVVVL